MVPAEAEGGLADCGGGGLADVVVLDDAEVFVHVLLGFVGDADEHETVFLALPDCVEGHLHLWHVVRNTNLLCKPIHSKPPLPILPNIIRPPLPLIIMPRLKPRHHRT